MTPEEIRALLPERERDAFDDIVLQRVLGAGRHVSMIGRMFTAIAADAAGNGGSASAALEGIAAVAGYFKATRGEASCAVRNAIDFMMRGMASASELPAGDAAVRIRAAVASYAADMERNVGILTDNAVSMCRDMDSVLVFDYSSTVSLFLEKLGAVKPGLAVYVPESRIINGGYPYVTPALAAGLRVRFVPDAALLYCIERSDAVFFGAETFYADGTAFNTVGSDVVALACRHHHVPLYVLTPLVKLDIRSLRGFVRNQVWNGLDDKAEAIGFKPGEADRVDFACPELLPVGPEYITAFSTEAGIVPPSGLFQLCLEYAKAVL